MTRSFSFLISALLTRYSYAVDQSADALATEELLARKNYDAVLMDLNLRDGGIDFLRHTLERHPALKKKLIILTAHAYDARQLADVGFAAPLRKPVEINEVIDAVGKSIRGGRE